MIKKLPEIQVHSCAKINEKLNEVIDWINDVSALRVTDNQVTANLPNIDAGELSFLSKENTELKDELERTRKALDKAKLVLANLRDWAELDGIQECDVYEALEQITALEQKE